jgi:hypothetical protein
MSELAWLHHRQNPSKSIYVGDIYIVWFSYFLKYLFHWTPCSFVDLHGVFRMDRRVLDWKRWRFRCWNWRLSPIVEFHRSIWIWVLLCIEGVCFLLIELLSFRVASELFRFWSSCFIFVLMCLARVSLLSRCMPRYFTSFFWGRSTLPICTVGQVWLRLRRKYMCTEDI